MPTRPEGVAVRAAVLGAVLFAYFVVFPQDLDSLLAPLGKVLALSHAVSPGLYAVVGVGILAWAILRVWGARGGAPREPT